ncbi:MAG: hypothetical protein M3O78_03920 [Chloroflexota bacterium]|nr:hypothetical protein [Chloroflexota bacterium]
MRRLVAMALAAAAVLLPAGSARAADYIMATVAHYSVDQAAGQVAVRIEVAFSNTTPNPPGQLSGFDHVEIAVHSGASQVSAEDVDGHLDVQLSRRDGTEYASVAPRSRIGSGDGIDFTLSYRLADGAPDVHVRPQVVQFPAWGFGTSGAVTVDLPPGFEVQVDGGPLTGPSDARGTHLTSGPILDPAAWMAYLTAATAISYTTSSRTVALGTGTVELQVRAWASDPTWGRDSLDLLAAALPLLEQAVGLPYPRLGPLVVVETVSTSGSAAEGPSSTAEIQADYSASPFTLIHQLAHVWAGAQLSTDRWIREGLASHLASVVAAQLHVKPPYDPATRASELAADAIPLETWSPSAVNQRQEAYGYAASWSLIDQIARQLGEEKLRRVLADIEAGHSAYDPYDPAAAQPADPGSFAPVDSRRFLDHLATVSSLDPAEAYPADAFAEKVFPAEDAPELLARAIQLQKMAGLGTSAGDWGVPLPVRKAMADWRFDDAQAAIGQATRWLTQRNDLEAAIGRASLATPDRLEERWRSDGGDPTAMTELDAEKAVVSAYQVALDRSKAGRGILPQIGLLGGEEPKTLLQEAAASFAAGDLQGATATISRTVARLNSATLDGIMRSASAVLVGAVMVVLTVRPRSRPTDYTAAP